MKGLWGHTSEETAYVVPDWPWGFKFKTEKRIWIEYKENKGERVAERTKDPRTGNWCKTTHSTYSKKVGIYLDDDGKVKFCHIHNFSSRSDEIDLYLQLFEEYLSVEEVDRLKRFRAHCLRGVGY